MTINKHIQKGKKVQNQVINLKLEAEDCVEKKNLKDIISKWKRIADIIGNQIIDEDIFLCFISTPFHYYLVCNVG